MRKISILGSTGSIGTQTLEVVENLGDIRVAAITGNKNIALLEKQARKFQPELVAVMDAENAKALQSRLSDTKIRIVRGMDGLVEAATYEDVDTVVTSVVGNVGLQPTFAAIRAGKISRLRIRDACFRRTACNGLCETAPCEDLSCGQRTLCYLPVLTGKCRQPHFAYSADSLRRPLPRQKQRGAGACNGGGCTGTPELAHGQEDYD